MARLSRSAAPVLGLLLALTAGGCSFSWQLDSLFGKNAPDATTTGSIPEQRTQTANQAPSSEIDLAYAKAAAADVLARGGQDASQAWENPNTGARGTITPISAAHASGGTTCREFLASYVRDGAEASWMQGEACQIDRGHWEVRKLEPWRRS